MARISRHNYAVVGSGGGGQFFGHTQQILKSENAPHRGRREMLSNNRLVNRTSALKRGLAGLAKLLVEKSLGNLAIFLPPTSNRARVVRCRRDHAQIGRVLR